jgi:predicted RNA methylase
MGLDKYYTKRGVINSILNYIDFDRYDLIVEPSAGDNRFIDTIKNLYPNKKIIGIDIQPENSNIIKCDYLKFESYPEYCNLLVIGNPPFGRQSNLAVKFFNKAAEKAACIAFILPRSFKKESVQRKLNVNFHLDFEIDLPKNSFEYESKSYDIPCVFQRWIKKDIIRSCNIVSPIAYKFVKKNETHDIVIQRVGSKAGMIKTCTDVSEQSHYFIKFDFDYENIITELNDITYDHSNDTVGPKSISKQEIVVEFNRIISLMQYL